MAFSIQHCTFGIIVKAYSHMVSHAFVSWNDLPVVCDLSRIFRAESASGRPPFGKAFSSRRISRYLRCTFETFVLTGSHRAGRVLWKRSMSQSRRASTAAWPRADISASRRLSVWAWGEIRGIPMCGMLQT